MSGSKNADTSSSSNSKTNYSTTTTTNPFFKSTTNNEGTTTTFNSSGLQDAYNYVNNNYKSMLDEINNPSLDTATNQAKINQYNTQLAKQTKNNLNNDVISPLLQRNMINSSVANDMYNNLMNKNQESYANYLDSLLASSQSDALQKAAFYGDLYGNIYNMLSGNQTTSLQTSSGNANKSTDTTGSSTV